MVFHAVIFGNHKKTEEKKMQVLKSNGNITVISGVHEWIVSEHQAYSISYYPDKIYKLDENYTLFESETGYGLVRIIDSLEKKDNG